MHFMKVWLRAEKYKMRGFSIDYPKKITMENVIYNHGYDYDLPPSINAMYDKIIDGKFFIRKERKSVFEKMKEKKVLQFNVETQTTEEMEALRAEVALLKDQLAMERDRGTQMRLLHEKSITDMEYNMIALKEELMKYKEMMGEIKSLVE